MSTAPKILRMDGTPDPEADRLAALEERVQALEIWMGMAPVRPDPPAPPEVPPRRVARVKPAKPQSEQAKAVAAIFRRKLETKWSPKEITAFEDLGDLDMADLLTIANFYESERAKGVNGDGEHIGFHRHSLGTFLNNYSGELDKATAWATRHPAAARKPLSTGPAPKAESEPPGWQEWFDRTYSTKAGCKWNDCPPDIRKLYR